MTTEPFDGKAAVVTGAGSGIGRATARLLAARGAKVCCADIDLTAADSTAQDITSMGGSAFGQRVDVTDPQQNAEMVREVTDRWGALHLAHLNAGLASPKQAPITEMPIEDFDKLVAVNLRGVFLGLRACGAAIRDAGGGAMVVTSSVAGVRVAGAGGAAYAATKHGAVGLAKVAAIDLGIHGIRVNAVCPGTVATELFTRKFGGDGAERMEALNRERAGRIPLGRVGDPADVAHVVAFLLSDDAAYVTGSVYMVDGGATAMSGALRNLPGREAHA
jgi:NAD(P)-dependent dehydrogenase (short-subunit alcohol dehydrogenase family)